MVVFIELEQHAKGVPAEKFSKLTISLFPTKVDVLPAPVVQCSKLRRFLDEMVKFS